MRTRLAAFLILLGGVVASAGCARTENPAGGPVPETPLTLVAVTPEPFSVVDPFDGAVRFQSDRPLSERLTRGNLRDAVVVSPRTGAVQVRATARGVEVRMEGGFRDRTVYRVTLLPVFQDRFRNGMTAPVELYFSTGPEFQPTLLAGYVEDRITGSEVRDARVDAVPVDGGATHTAVTDSLGVFSFRFLPADRYDLRAYVDLNRNGEPDFGEPQAGTQLLLAPADTIIVTELTLLANDSTAAVPERVRLIDSLTVEVEFDDYLDPASPSAQIVAAFRPEPAGTAFAAARIFHAWEWELERERRRSEAAAGDPSPLTEAPPTEAPPVEGRALRPDRRLILVLSEPLAPDSEFTVGVANVTNLNGIPEGRGEVTLRTPPAG